MNEHLKDVYPYTGATLKLHYSYTERLTKVISTYLALCRWHEEHALQTHGISNFFNCCKHKRALWFPSSKSFSKSWFKSTLNGTSLANATHSYIRKTL